MSNKKDYLIQLFLKCSSWLSTAEKNLNFNESFLRSCYDAVGEDTFEEVFKEQDIEKFKKGISNLIDDNFSIDEINELISFFRSPVGRKIVNKSFILKIENILNDIYKERERKISKVDRE